MRACARRCGGLLFHYFHIDLIFILTAVLVSAVFFIVFFLLRKKKPLVYVLIAFIFFAIGFISCYLRFYFFGLNEIDENTAYYVVGKVVEKGNTANGEFIILDNVTADGRALGGKTLVYMKAEYGEYCDIGYKVEFQSKLTAQDLFAYGRLNRNVEDDIRFSCKLLTELKSTRGFSLFGSIRSAIGNVLYSNLDKDTAAICYGMLVGKTGGVDDEVMTAFRYGGIAHIFAVSGLHIGIVYGITDGLCKKLRVNKFAGAAVSLSFILFYAAICGFTVSSVRAVIMCSATIFARLAYVKRDGLNSLAFAVVLILLISPPSLFSVGFQLSVCAVGGIFVFSKNIIKASSKIKIPVFVSDKYATTAGAQLGTLPVLASSFGYISGAGLLLNIVFVPVLSFAFVLIFLSTFTALIIPAAGIILPSAVVPLEVTLSFVVNMGLEKSLISGFGGGLFALIYFAGVLSLSDKLNLGAAARTVGFAALVIALAAYVLARTYSPASGHEIVVSGSASGGSVLIKSREGSVLVITEHASPSSVKNSVNENYGGSPDAVILLCEQEYVTLYGYDYDLGCKEIYLSNLYFPAQPDGRFNFNYEHNFTLFGVQFEFVDTHTLAFVCDGVSVAVCATDYMRLKSCDVLISKNLNYNPATNAVKVVAKETIYFSQKGTVYNTYDYGEMKIRTGGGNFSFTRPPVKH